MENLVPPVENSRVRLKPRVNEPHPWFVGNVVEETPSKPRNGSVVDVENARGLWIGRGFYNGHARIRVRVLTRDRQEAIDAAFFQRRIEAAIQWRRQLGLLSPENSNGGDACRLVHSEGDNLSGLIVDRYGDLLVVQFISAGMFQRREQIKVALESGLSFLGVEKFQFYLFAEKRVQKQESFDCYATEPVTRIITEDRLRFNVAVGSKHKTGFFLDQRENRQRFAKFATGKSVLDLCCHTGGFSIASARASARKVTGLDLDPESISLAQRNAALNRFAPDAINFLTGDLLRWQSPDQEKYDLIVLDPSKQTRSEEGTAPALRKYFDMNAKALTLMNPGGILLTCSCSGRITEKEFINALREAAFATRKTLQVFAVTGAAADHPFLLHVPESRYLKAVWARLV